MPKFYFYCIFIFATLFYPQSALSRLNLNDQSCGLECWLANLTINIPPQSTVDYGFNFTIQNMLCKGIQIGGINSSFIPPSTLIINPYNVSIMCQATWSYSEIDWPHLSDSGTAYATVNGSSLLLGLSLIQGANGLAESANTTLCDANITITNLTFTGGYSWVLNLFRSYVASTIESELDTVTCQQLTNLVNVNLTQSLQQLDQLIVEYLVPQPPTPAPPLPDSEFINLMTDSRVQVLEYIFRSLFTSSGELSFNTLIDRFTNGTGSVSLNANDLKTLVFTFPVWASNTTYLGNITVGFNSINVSSLNTWGSDVDLSSVDNSTMRFHSDMSDLKVNVSFKLNISLGGDAVVAETLYEEGILSADFKHNDFNLTFQLAIFQDKFDNLQATQFQDINCLLDTLYSLNITQMFFNTTVASLAIDAVSGDIEHDLDSLIDNVLDLFTSTYGPAIPAFVNAMASTQLQQQLNDVIFQEISKNGTCEPPQASAATFDRQSTVYAFSGASGLFAIFALVLFWFVRRGDKEMEEERPLIWKDTNPPLVVHPRISLFTRLAIPFFLLFNVALFISSNTSVGASVFIILTSGDYTITTPPLFQFSLGNSVRDMWNAGVYPLSILIAVFSGSWPYIKLLIMLVCWISKLPIKSREYLLMAIDMLGKWSLIDAFVMTLMMVAFQFHVGTGDVEGMSPANANVYVQPHWGFYMFLIATMLSLILTHIVLALHHYAVDNYEEEDEEESLREALWYYAFKSDTSHKAWTALKRYIVVLLLVVAFGLISWGVYTVSFAFNFKGAAGLLLQLLGEKTETSYSVLSLGLALPGAAPPGGHNLLGVRMIEATFFTFTVAVPLVHLFVLLMLWVVPLSFPWQRKVFVVTEVLNAWSALEVFVVSIIAAVLEIRQFAAFIVGDKCDPINSILKEYFNQELDSDAKCFDVIATLEAGCWILFAACIIYMGVATLVMRVCHRAIKEHENQSDDDFSRIN